MLQKDVNTESLFKLVGQYKYVHIAPIYCFVLIAGGFAALVIRRLFRSPNIQPSMIGGARNHRQGACFLFHKPFDPKWVPALPDAAIMMQQLPVSLNITQMTCSALPATAYILVMKCRHGRCTRVALDGVMVRGSVSIWLIAFRKKDRV